MPVVVAVRAKGMNQMQIVPTCIKRLSFGKQYINDRYLEQRKPFYKVVGYSLYSLDNIKMPAISS